jgi:hypothetical protein
MSLAIKAISVGSNRGWDAPQGAQEPARPNAFVLA